MAQLPLALGLTPHASLASFVAGPNTAAVEHVRGAALGERRESVWLCGPKGTGKSHLLAAACRAAGEAGRRPIYLALDPSKDPAMLRELDSIDLVALDDVHEVAGRDDWDAALFGVFEARLEHGGLVAAASGAPRECSFSLPDLASRAGAAFVYRLGFLGDEELRSAVLAHAGMRGLALEPPAVDFLLQRLRRDIGELTECLDRIDRYSLAAKRRITIPLLREVIGR